MVNPRPNLKIITDYETLDTLIKNNLKKKQQQRSKNTTHSYKQQVNKTRENINDSIINNKIQDDIKVTFKSPPNYKLKTNYQSVYKYTPPSIINYYPNNNIFLTSPRTYSSQRYTFCSPKGIVSLNSTPKDNSFYSTNMSLLSTPGYDNPNQPPVTFTFNETSADGKKGVTTKVNNKVINSYPKSRPILRVVNNPTVQPVHSNKMNVVNNLEKKVDNIRKEQNIRIKNTLNQKIKHSTSYSDLLKRKNKAKNRKEKTKTWCVVNSNPSDNIYPSEVYEEKIEVCEPPTTPPPPPPREKYNYQIKNKKNKNVENITIEIENSDENNNSQSFVIASALSDSSRSYSSPRRTSSLILSPYFYIQNQLANLIQNEEKLNQQFLNTNPIEVNNMTTTSDNILPNNFNLDMEMKNLNDYMNNMNLNVNDMNNSKDTSKGMNMNMDV